MTTPKHTDALPALLPCPFCGSGKVGWRWIKAYSVDSSYAVVGCEECEASIPAYDEKALSGEDVSAWNRRAALASRAEPNADALPALPGPKLTIVGDRDEDFGGHWYTIEQVREYGDARAAHALASRVEGVEPVNVRLLDALEQLIACHDEPTCPAIDVARAVIANAEVQPAPSHPAAHESDAAAK